EPFNKFQPYQKEHLHSTYDNDYMDIINIFIQTVEQSSDSINYLWKKLLTIDSKNHEKIAHEVLAKAESSKLYFDSFLRFYSDQFDKKWLDNKKTEMEFRMRKIKIAYSTVYNERKDENEHDSIKIASIALKVSEISAITSIIAAITSIVVALQALL
ncbi:MAG: hypothetical protein MJZ68_09340, partial [archaeon]|nr:hypothetical protein [archaeon]